MSESEALAGDFRGALGNISVPSYVIDRAGVIRWVNPAAIELVGDVRGQHFTRVVAPEDSSPDHGAAIRSAAAPTIRAAARAIRSQRAALDRRLNVRQRFKMRWPGDARPPPERARSLATPA